MAYNRFRYYNPETGSYISKDPIGLAGNTPNLYAYTFDSNTTSDPFGLNPLVGLDLGNMTREQIGEILSGAKNISWKGGYPDGQFMQWKYTDTGNTAVRIDPPDAVTKYDHLYDNNGSSLDIKGNKVDPKSPDAHIRIKCK